MPSFAMTVPYMRTSPLGPRRDLVLGRADSLFLCASPSIATILARRRLTSPEASAARCFRSSGRTSITGRRDYDVVGLWRIVATVRAAPGAPGLARARFRTPLGRSTSRSPRRACPKGHDVAPTRFCADTAEAAPTCWPRPAPRTPVPRSISPAIMLTDPRNRRWTDDAGNVILLDGTSLASGIVIDGIRTSTCRTSARSTRFVRGRRAAGSRFSAGCSPTWMAPTERFPVARYGRGR